MNSHLIFELILVLIIFMSLNFGTIKHSLTAQRHLVFCTPSASLKLVPPVSIPTMLASVSCAKLRLLCAVVIVWFPVWRRSVSWWLTALALVN